MQSQPAAMLGGRTASAGGLIARPRFDAGRPCLNLLATLGRRGATPVERVANTGDFAAWLTGAGLLDAPVPVSEQEAGQMRQLRQAIFAVIDAARRTRTPDPGAVAVVNSFAAHPAPWPRLSADGRAVTRHSGDPVRAALAVLARDTIDLVTGADLARVRECAAPECRMLFLDTSRGGRRRWCSMARCGNRAKARAYAARSRTPDRGRPPSETGASPR